MGRISSHFKREEFACKCGCGLDMVDAILIHKLEHCRLHFNAPIIVNSGVRCHNHNRSVGGSKNSQHLYGKAADIVVKGVDPQAVHNFFETEYDGTGGLGVYETFTHVDSRDKKARWIG